MLLLTLKLPSAPFGPRMAGLVEWRLGEGRGGVDKYDFCNVGQGGYRGVTWLYNLFIGTVAGEETGFIKCDVMP